MSNTFKPGDRVRRTITGTNPEIKKGEIYTVESNMTGLDLRLKGLTGIYAPNYFELVEPAPVEFQKGDRVRATAKEGDDFAEFTVTSVNSRWLDSARNAFRDEEWDFELLSRPEPPKSTNQEIWDSLPIGQKFHFGDSTPDKFNLKVSPTHFYAAWVPADEIWEVEPWVENFGVTPITD